MNLATDLFMAIYFLLLGLSVVKRVWKESKLMWVVAAPAIFTRFSTFGINVITHAFVGHIGSRELAAFALVFTVLIRFGNSILLGMGTALSTLCGQAYGAKEYGMMGVYIQRSWIVLSLTALCLLPLLIFAIPILTLLDQDETIAQVAGTISLWSIPVLFSFIVSFTTQTFLQSQSKNIIIAFLAAFSIVIHVFLSWLLTMKFKLGIAGAMTSTSLALWIPNIGQLIFITCGWCYDTSKWKGFSFLAFKDLWPVVKLSLSSLPTNGLNINGWELMISLGFMAAASVRVAKGSSKAAKISIVVKEKLAYIFTSSKDVADAVGDLSPLLAISILLNSVQPVLSGIPVGVVLGNVLHLQVKGIWFGMLFGTFIQTIVLIIITYKTNWDEQGNLEKKLLSKEEVSEEDNLSLVKRVWEESKEMWIVAAPAIFTRFTTFGINVISQAFIGHIGSRELAAYALVFTVIIRFANGILLGMSSALSTLCGQAYGAKEYDMMGVYLQRSSIVLFLTALCLLPVFIFTSPILMLLGQDENIAQVAGTISLWSIPILFAYIVSFNCQTFLQSQSKNVVIAFLAALSIIIHVFLSWLLTIQFKFGIPGAMISTILAFWIPNIGQLIFITCGWCDETWKGFSFLAFKDLGPVVKLSLSSGAILELWYNTVLILLTGNMKNAEVEINALSICININGWEMMIALGFMAAAREKIAYLFTSNEDVVTAVGDLSPLLALSLLLNSIQPVLSGVAVGAGWQSTVAYVNIGCYYLIGIPVGIVLGNIIHLEVKGIWIGMLFGTLVQTIVLTIITYKTNWDEQPKTPLCTVKSLIHLQRLQQQPKTQKMEGNLEKKLLSREQKSEEENLSLVKRVWEESKVMWIVAAPAIFTRFTTFGISIISQAFIGHIGSRELAAYALVFTVIIRFANGILLGMASALSTLCGQAYGAKEYDMMGVYLQRSWIVLFLSAICLLPLFIFTSPILTLLGQDESIAQVARTISIWSIPVLFAYIVSNSCQTFLQSQSKNVIISYLAALSIIIHVSLSWLFTMQFKYGIPGAMISTILAYWIPNIGQMIFITCGWCPETWKGFSFLAFKDLWPVAKLSISSGAILELWYNTILILLTGNMKDAEVQIDALSICINISGWEMMIAFGFMAAVSVRVANELGRENSKAAKFSIVVTVLTSFAIGFILFVLFLILREKVAYLFTSNEDVVTAVGDLSPLLALSLLLNSIQPVLSGVAVGAGWQSTVAYVNIGCYYLIGIPVGIVLGNIIHLQVKGIWIGMLFGTLIQTIILIIITYKTNWDEQVIIARNRISKWSKVDLDRETVTSDN
ncbi:Protein DETOXIFICATION 21 [Glycine max]|nr:Protein DETOXIFICATION 21 [Glycine max]